MKTYYRLLLNPLYDNIYGKQMLQMKCNSIDFCLDYLKFMRNLRIPQVFTLIPLFTQEHKKSSYEIRNCLIFKVDQPEVEPETSRL